MRVLTGPPVVQVALEHPAHGTWAEAPMKRKRTGIYPGANVVTEAMLHSGVMEAHARLLSNEELWSVYRQVPDVRAAVEAVCRLISTWDWTVEPVEELGADDPLHDRALDLSEEVRRFLSAPNTDGEVWQTWVSKAARDLLVYDAWATENVIGREGVLEELVVLPGGTIHPRQDRHARLVDFKQVTGDTEVYLDREQVVYFNLFPNSNKAGGTPLIETLIHEVIIMMRSSKHLMLAYDADEVAPGVLLLAGLAGKSAERAVGSLQNMAGADHKLRVITTNNPQGIDAKWVEFRHTPKDLDMQGLVKEVQRRIWRTFGVKPVTMGDSEATPRATAEVQMDAEDSGLIRPILELLQAQVNARILPLIVDDPDLAGLLQFSFDLDRDATPQDQKAEAETDAIDFDRGGLTVNELRAKRGRLPVEGGDVALVKAGGSYALLSDVLAGGGEDTSTTIYDASDDPGEGGEVDSGTVEAGTPDEGEEAPGEVEASRGPVFRSFSALGRPVSRMRAPLAVRRASTCTCGHHHSEPSARFQRAASLLPSEWQPGGKFEGYRTMRLDRLGEVLTSYSRAVHPLYRRAKLDTVSAFRAYLADGVLDAQEAGNLAREVSAILERLVLDWDASTANEYREAAKIARDAATDFTRQPVVYDWRERAENYQRQAIAYLTDTRGLISDINTQLQTLMLEAQRSRSGVQTRIAFDEQGLAFIAAVAKVFERNRNRIENWSGRLVELANEVFTLGMSEGGPPVSGDGGGIGDDDIPEPPGSGEWYVEWAAVGDARMCVTCEREGDAGFRPLSQVPVRPGGATECRARCRCVLVFWTRQEVDNGTAKGLSGKQT